MMSKTPDIDTKRLILKEITEKDTELIVKWRSEANVHKYFLSPHVTTANEHMEWFKTRYLYNMNRFDYIARTKEDGTAVGVFGIKIAHELKDTVEISYILDSLYYGKGYAKEATSKLIEFAKDKWKCNVAIAKIHMDNKNSVHFIEKLGFSFISKKGYFVIYSKKL